MRPPSDGGASSPLQERALLLLLGGAFGFAAAHAAAAAASLWQQLLQQRDCLTPLKSICSSSSNSSSNSSSSSEGLGFQSLLVDRESLLQEAPCLFRVAAAATAAAGTAGGAAADGPFFECLLSRRQVERQGRQLLLSSWGVGPQKQAGCCRVLLVGAGGLGGPIALYLIGAGIG